MASCLSRAAMLAVFVLSLGAPMALAEDTVETPASSSSADFTKLKSMVDSGDYANALPALQALNAQSPNNPDVLNLIGFSLRKTGHADQALDFYNKALALKPDHLGANEYLGELYLELKQPEKAKERLETLRQACGGTCEEFTELQDKIDQAAAAQ